MPIEVIVPPTEYLLITTSVVAMEIQPCPQILAQIGEFWAKVLFTIYNLLQENSNAHKRA